MSRTLSQDINKIVEALGRVFGEEGRPDVANLISEAQIGFEETSYDNWNGGTYGYTLQLGVPARTSARLGASAEELEKELQARIERFTRLYPNEHVQGVLIVPSLEEQTPKTAIQDRAVATPSFWKEDSFRLFFSHVSAFKLEASELARNLAPYGVCGFVAHEDIEPTKEWGSSRFCMGAV